MEVESISDALSWGEHFHAGLAQRLEQSNTLEQGEREAMLLQYLAEQEKKIAHTFEEFQNASSMKQLKTWSYDYQRTFPTAWREEYQSPYRGLDADELISRVEHEHNKAIEFYEGLKSKALIQDVVELLDHLVDYEHSEASRLAQSANRLHDL